MEILSVTLKNFKSHGDRHFTFQPGTNAICGENGAGKTTILEAIAWVLFDYTGDYTREDLIRNGAASAQVRVAFISNRDGRTYEVQRCTTKSYTLYDPQLNERLPYSRIKEEVMPWLRQHLGVAPGTDLSQLFCSTVGVPQGTFTADFLLTREKRKPIFDRILKVEEYQQTWKKLADLEKFARGQVETLEQEIARYQEELQEFDQLQQRRQEQQEEIAQVQANLHQVQARLTELQREQTELASVAARSQQLDTQLEQFTAQMQTQSRNLERFQTSLQQAAAAVALCTEHREAYHAFLQAEERLRELEQQQRTELALQQKKRKLEKQQGDHQTELTRLTLQLNRVAEARQEIERLEPLARQQSELEQDQQALNQQLQTVQGLHQPLQHQEKRLAQLQSRRTQIADEISRLQALATTVQEIPALEQQQQRYQQQLSRVAAAADFEADLRQLLAQVQGNGEHFLTQVQQAEATLKDIQAAVPLWSTALDSVLTTLHHGSANQQQLTTALQEIVDDLVEQRSTAKLTEQLQAVQTQLQTARQHQAQMANLERLLADQMDLEREAEELQASLVEVRAQLAQAVPLQEQADQLAAQLAALENPRTRMQLWQKELHQGAALQTQVQEVRAVLDEFAAAIAQLDRQLAEFADVSGKMQAQQELREIHRNAYELYMANREMANSQKSQQQQVQEATEELQALQRSQAAVREERDRLALTFDPTHFQAVQTAYQAANAEHIALTARLPDMLKLLESLDQQVARLQALQVKQTQALSNLEQKKKTERFVKFARKAYKEAGPRITERYIHSISREADKLFRELLNRPNVSLQWTRDYEILIQEGAHSRRFVNLSGGEQMCAALAVRLALLKVLADIDIAFFDEPTTNMDRLRREQLADAIANIKTFRQLFVISHDDTFEKVTENVILVEREE